MSDGSNERALEMSMTAMGFTLVSVVINIALTVAFGVTGAWWVRVAAGGGTAVALLVGLALASRKLHALRRAARWVTAYRRS